jgi:hypothetical protein
MPATSKGPSHVTKAALCVHCSDIVSPHRDWQTNRDWRWCECGHAAVRWRDGARGLIEVTALHGSDHVRVLGINNLFLTAAVSTNPYSEDGRRNEKQWRALHELACERVEPNYLFHKDRRNCWVLVVRVGESGDVTFVPYAEARYPSPEEESSP